MPNCLKPVGTEGCCLTACGMLQIRALLYVGALSNGILEALAHAERAVTDAIITAVLHPCCTGRSSALHTILGSEKIERSNAAACLLGAC